MRQNFLPNSFTANGLQMIYLYKCDRYVSEGKESREISRIDGIQKVWTGSRVDRTGIFVLKGVESLHEKIQASIKLNVVWGLLLLYMGDKFRLEKMC